VRKLALNRVDLEAKRIKMRLLTYITLVMLLTSCSHKRIISVEINRDKLTIDNKVIDKTDFEERLKIKIDSLLNSGLNKSMIDVQVTADKQISTNEMSEIEKAIRRQGVTRDYIWSE
jgi:biopolymer transport protein ExbD